MNTPAHQDEIIDFEPLIDRLIIHFTSEIWRAEVAIAKKEFFQDAGIMDEGADHFEMRMSQFLDWYLFTRKLKGRMTTPAQYVLEIDDFPMTPHERVCFECLAGLRHSLFEYLRLRGDDITIRDLFAEKEIVIRNSQVNVGFTKDEIFEARLIPFGEDYIFARAFCFHPTEASHFIKEEVGKIQEEENEDRTREELEDLILRLSKMRYRFEQFRHLKVDLIYSNEKKVRY